MSRRRIVAWLLVFLVSVQGLATGVLIATGPNHTHDVTTRDMVVLEDFRRLGAHAAPGEIHFLASIGHFHAAGAPARHYHPRSDLGVVFEGDGWAQIDQGTGASSAAALMLCAAILPSQAPWLAGTGPSSPISHSGWPLLTHDPLPLKRPPRAV